MSKNVLEKLSFNEGANTEKIYISDQQLDKIIHETRADFNPNSGVYKIGNGLTLQANLAFDIHITRSDESEVRYKMVQKSHGNSCGEIDFTPKIKGVERLNYTPESFNGRNEAIKHALISFLKVIDLIENGSISLDYIKGISESDMHNFAKKFGFKDSNFGIVISSNDLLDQKSKIRKILKSLLTRENRSSTDN